MIEKTAHDKKVLRKVRCLAQLADQLQWLDEQYFIQGMISNFEPCWILTQKGRGRKILKHLMPSNVRWVAWHDVYAITIATNIIVQ